MKRPLTPRQRELVELAGRLADTFAKRAAEHDRENTFPVENYDDLREAGYLRLTVPEELGGGGATLPELVLAQERLAMGDGSTALAVNMHVSPIGQWASVWRDTRDERLEELLREVAAGKVIWASLTAEPGVANNLMDANTVAAKVEGGYRVNGRKIFCTNSVVATHFSFSARYDDPETGPRLMLFRAAKEADGFEFVQTWDTLGMRATQSNDLAIEDGFVPDEAVVHSLPVNHFDARILKTVFAWAMPTFGCVYLGIAAGAMEIAKGMVRKRNREGDQFVQASFAQMEMLLETARAVLWRHCEEVVSGALFELGVQEGLARAGLAKVIPANNAVEIMRHVVDVTGGAAYMRKLPLERMWRDVQAGPIMPYSNHQALELFGATSLGVQLAPEIPLEESGVESRPRPVTATAG
ncbi:MAG: acyl-CoA/acyl-ACP dehydrogenase [Actinobacteria bacterium]|nr:acyl-CoA/acyl-ACP dehydrogenase [Actinomycetota bacterium]